MTDMIFQNVTKAFGEKKVITDFSERVCAGECVLLRGPSGCGKTTLLRLAAGLETPDTGTILRPEGSIGYVFQENRLIEFLSAMKNLLLVCKTPQQKEEAEELLSRMGLSAQDKKPVSAYSGGMKRRVAIARAVLTAPKLLLLDEPFTGLDAENRRIAAETLLAGRIGRVTLLVSHDEADGELMCADRIRNI